MATVTQKAPVSAEVPDRQGVDPKKVQIWERRFVNPGRESAQSIHLRDEGFETRWVNTGVEGRFHRAVHEQGWTPVRPSELGEDPADLGFQVVGETVRRGERGVEVLMKIPTSVFKLIRQRKGQLEIESLKKTRQNIAEATARQFGSEAGDWAFDGRPADEDRPVSGLRGKVLDYRERRVVDSQEESA